MTRELISVRTETYKLINKARGKKTFNAFLHDLVTKHRKGNLELATLRKEVIQLKEQLSNSPQSIQTLEVDCKALIELNEGFVCAIKAPKITPIPSLLICKFCLDRQWEQNQTQKATKTRSKSLSFYKKPKEILCKTGYWENPKKIQARCERCKQQTLQTWLECQQRQQTIRRENI